MSAAAEYARLKGLSLSLDMTRGKPCPAQLDLSNRLLSLPADDFLDGDIDARNYGGIDGLPAVKQLFADILGVNSENVIVGGNSSLAMMYDAIARACQFGAGGDAWNCDARRKFICAVPGYDRHFAITAHFGFELIAVDMTADGPDMSQVEAAVADAAVKGIWCVPKYSNPSGVCYSDDTVRRLAEMKTAAADFRIFWDNAYAEHHFTADPPTLANIAELCAAAGNARRVIQFASTSKMCHPGSGVAAMASDAANIADARTQMAVQTIGPDKINQLRLLKFFGDLDGLRAHMKKHAAIIAPKFDAVQEILARELGGLGIAKWSKPQGGYFISLDLGTDSGMNLPGGGAKRVVELAGEAGVKLTAAGAPFPHGADPHDRNIRIAPTFPSVDEVRQATEVLAVCIKVAAGM